MLFFIQSQSTHPPPPSFLPFILGNENNLFNDGSSLSLVTDLLGEFLLSSAENARLARRSHLGEGEGRGGGRSPSSFPKTQQQSRGAGRAGFGQHQGFSAPPRTSPWPRSGPAALWGLRSLPEPPHPVLSSPLHSLGAFGGSGGFPAPHQRRCWWDTRCGHRSARLHPRWAPWPLSSLDWVRGAGAGSCPEPPVSFLGAPSLLCPPGEQHRAVVWCCQHPARTTSPPMLPPGAGMEQSLVLPTPLWPFLCRVPLLQTWFL